MTQNISKWFITIPMLMFTFGCGDLHGPWVLELKDRSHQPGLLVIGPSKQIMTDVLEKHALKGRILSSDKNIYEIDSGSEKQVRSHLKNAIILHDRRFQFPTEEEPLLLELEADEAAKFSKQQLQWLELDKLDPSVQGQDVLVAVIDSGVDIERFDLRSNIVGGWNFQNDSADVLDRFPHGTMSAAVIASSVTGIAPQAKILPLAITDDQGVATLSAVVEAILYATEKGVRIINLSMGGNKLSEEERQAIEALAAKNILFVQSAGNMRQNCKDVPALGEMKNFSTTLLVGALNLPPTKPELAAYSNHGECVDIAAPAGIGAQAEDYLQRGIVAAHPSSQNRYHLYHGTSAAAPVVSGVAALLMSARPDLTAEEVKACLLKSGITVEKLNKKVRTKKMVNAFQALQC